MPHYRVFLNEQATYEVCVFARNEEEAEEKAEARFVALGAASFPVEVHDREAERVEEIKQRKQRRAR